MMKDINKPVLFKQDKRDREDSLEAGGAVTGFLSPANYF
jgi:hypothetical protein